MKKIMAITLALVMTLCAFSFAAAEEATHKLGIDLCADDLFNQQIREVLVSACEERGWEYLVTVNYQDAANNVSNVQNMLTVGCDYIMSYSTDIGAEVTVNQLCADAGVGVVFIGLEEEGYTTVAGGNYDGGYFVGQKLVEKANEIWGGQIDLVIVNEFAEVGAAVLTAHPEATHILCLCAVDDYQGHGSWNAASAAGRQDQIIIGGFHVVNPATPGLLVNNPNVWVGQADLLGSEYGKTALKMFDAMIAGEDIVGQMWFCDFIWMDASNVGDYYEVVS